MWMYEKSNDDSLVLKMKYGHVKNNFRIKFLFFFSARDRDVLFLNAVVRSAFE